MNVGSWLSSQATRATPRRVLFPWLARRYFGARYAIVYYHGVWTADSSQLRLFGGITVQQLQRDLRWLARHFTFASLDQVLAAPGGGPPLLAVTFDDNHDLQASGAVDALDAAGVKATMFVNTATARGRGLMWQHALIAIRRLRGAERLLGALNRLQARLGGSPVTSAVGQLRATRRWPVARKDELTAELWRACDMPPVAQVLAQNHPYMDMEQLAQWRRRGHAVGFHTDTHAWCGQLDAAGVEAELLAPARALARDLAIPALPFAYPFGERLAPAMEAQVLGTRLFSCMLGVSGFSRRETPHHHVRRLDAEPGAEAVVAAHAVRESLRPRSDPPYTTLD